MMTDKQQIKELTKDLCEIECKGAKCYHCEYNCEYRMLAEALYNAGYRKVDENAVVLTQEEKQKLLHEMYEQGKFDIFIELGSTVYDNTRKETAKDFIFKVESYLGYNADNETFTKKELLLILAEVAKEQYGVEVE